MDAPALVSLKLPIALKSRITEEARNERRSMNSQIIVLLERALRAQAETVAAVSAE